LRKGDFAGSVLSVTMSVPPEYRPEDTVIASSDNTASGPSFWVRYRLVIGLVLLVSFLHYNTAVHIHALHGIYRRLYYFPIIIAAFRGGRRAGLLSSLLVAALYIPHSLGWIGFDPAPGIEKFLEMGLYLAMGVLTGTLVDRINTSRRELALTARDLRKALDEKSRMEAELVRTARLAAVGRLSAGLAHEIRNPLASIQGSAEVLGDEFPADHPKAGLTRILLQESRRLNDVLTRFLAFARNEPGETAVFDFAAEIRAVAHLLDHRPDGPHPVIRIEAPAPVRVRGNPEQTRQILLNLGLNAVQAADTGGEVTLTVDVTDRSARCEVRDSGPGFDPDALENFGTPFYSTRPGGTGLGLATSLRLAEDMGGRLEARTGPGGRISFSLPLAPRPESEETAWLAS